jgi:hypothetical protein
MIDRPAGRDGVREPRIVTRRDARVGFCLELAPLLFVGIYGLALSIGEGRATEVLAAIALLGLAAQGIGWIYLGRADVGMFVFVARLAGLAILAVATIGSSFTALGYALAAAAVVYALATPPVSAAALSIVFWPRTASRTR